LLKYSEKKETQLNSLKSQINKQISDSKFKQILRETNTINNIFSINKKLFKSDDPIFFSYSKNFTSLRNNSELDNNLFKRRVEANEKIKQSKLGVNTDLFEFTNSNIKAKSNSKNMHPVYFNKNFNTLSSINTSKYAKNLNVSNSVFNITKNLKNENNKVQSKSLFENETRIIIENKEKTETEKFKQQELKNKINDIDLNYLKLNKNNTKKTYQDNDIQQIQDLNQFENHGIINQKNEEFKENIDKNKEHSYHEENFTKAQEAKEMDNFLKKEKNEDLIEIGNNAGIKGIDYMDICKNNIDNNIKIIEKEEFKKSSKAKNITKNVIKKINDANYKCNLILNNFL